MKSYAKEKEFLRECTDKKTSEICGVGEEEEPSVER